MPRWAKVVLVIQIQSIFVQLLSSFYIISQSEEVLGILINIVAIIFVNELDGISGRLFLKHLRVNQMEITQRDDFLKFQTDKD